MSIASVILTGSVLALWLGVFGAVVAAALRERGRRRALGVVGGLLVMMGAAGFAAPMLGRWAPAGVEWPVGWAGLRATTPSGTHVVAHSPSGRVQVYDADWRFLRGWFVDCAGGVFVSLAPLPDGTVEVVTARTHARYVFDLDGNVLSRSPAPPPPSVGYAAGPGTFVFTWPWLLPLSHPSIAWALIPLGLVVLAAGGHVRL